MPQLSRQVLKTLWEDGDFILSRSMLVDEAISVLVLAPASKRPAPEIAARLEQTYLLREELEPSSVARPLRLVHHDESPALLLEDPGGMLLAHLLGQPWDLAKFLSVAIGIASSLGRLHARGLIHRDVNPANILVNLETGQAWLIGTRFMSRLPRGRLTKPVEEVSGTLAYIAPEQTGRMNHPIDTRSDLYSFGVILYEMLTGVLPFTADGPMEWVHCHVAKQPTPPPERVEGVPESISAIVMKLLAKTPEERYQTAAGIEADLQTCFAAWDTHKRIDRFPLGRRDMPDRLLLPGKLYGRDVERKVLLDAFDRVAASGRTELVLVSGYSGIGKSSIVNELNNVIVPPRGIFIAGKFDQQKRDIPYATLGPAFQGLVRQILSKSEDEVRRWREAIREAVSTNGQLMVNLIPELEFIVDKQPPVPDLPLEAAQSRFQTVFVRFLSVFARSEHPLVFFLDDLQWLDAATLELLKRLVTDPDVHHFLLVGAYRDNEVSLSHPLIQTLEKIRGAGVAVREIVLAPLSVNDTKRLVMDSLHCESDRAEPLAQLLHEKSGGNPFFAIQFLSTLADEGLLVFDLRNAVWTWELERIQARRYTDNVVELVTDKLKRLPTRTQRVLQQLACLGNSAKISTLNLIDKEPVESIQPEFWDAVRAGLVFTVDGTYVFLHDRIREAAYSLIPESERAATHLRIGRLLATSAKLGEAEEEIFEIVSQLNRAGSLITSLEERKRVAELNLIAGKRAKLSEAYASALGYFTASEAFLARDCWENDHPLAFDVFLNCAECEFRIGRLAEAEDRLATLVDRAVDLVDKSAVTRLRVALYMTQIRFDRAVEVCLEYLQNVGVKWSPHPTKDDVEQEYTKIWRQVGSRTIEQLVDLPLTNDPNDRATLDVLSVFTTPAWFSDENLHDLVVAYMANFSLEHGNSDGSCYAYAVLGSILGSIRGKYEAGFQFGKLSLDLVKKRGLDRFKARVYSCFGHHILPWTQHLDGGRVWNQRAINAAKESGDLPFAAFSSNNMIANLLAGGDPLEEVQLHAEKGLEFARKLQFGLVVDYITAQLRLIRTLRGLTPEFGSLNDPGFDEARFEQHLEGNPRLAVAECRYWIRKLQARFFANDYGSAIAAASKIRRLVRRPQTFFDVAEYPFFGALAHAAVYASASAAERPEHLEALTIYRKRLAVWKDNCPANFGSWAALVEAEIARIEGRELDAQHLYEAAIQSAREHGFVQNEAIAHEVAARFYSGIGLDTIARAYLGNARDLYLRWGALGKVRHLEQHYPGLSEQPRSSTDGTRGPSLAQLDFLALAEASQAVSSELELAGLIETLLVIALKNAGAQRGILVLIRDDKPQIEAEAITGRDEVKVHFHQAFITPAELPDSILRYVIRTQESIILDDATAPNQFSADGYLQRKQARSVLCLPLAKQASLKGALYLENNLASHVFTPERVLVLKLLVSQAAISLDHARLYAELTQEIKDRKRAEEELHQKEISLRESQAELARVSRVTTMGELAASIAHEVNQPLAGIVTNANATLRWLAGGSPDLDEAREAIKRIVRDGNRAGDVVSRMRSLFEKERTTKERLDINEAIEEVAILTQSEMCRNNVKLRLELGSGLPSVMGDRVQLQQVAVNLILNAIEAMNMVEDRERELIITTQRTEGDHVRVAVQDSGIGFDPQNARRMFDAFHTTKPGGLGMGLSISRSVVESHGGRLWAVLNEGPGATFQFIL